MIAISMRMMRTVYPNGSEELRDSIAHDWWRFFNAAFPAVPILPVPNSSEQAHALLEHAPVTGIILTGGDDWGVFPQRDATEEMMIRWAECKSIDILGVCRGAQVINLIMGGHLKLNLLQDHIGTRHTIRLCEPFDKSQQGVCPREVNSFHSHGMNRSDIAMALHPFAMAEDGTVEGFCSTDGRVTGIMWHPEREIVPHAHDISLIRRLLKGKIACKRWE